MYILGSDGHWYNTDYFVMIVPLADALGYSCHMEPLGGDHVTIRVSDADAIHALEKLCGIYHPALALRHAG